MGKAFIKLLEDKKSAILKSWMDAAVNSYAPDTAAFLKGQKDPFSNPVGGRLSNLFFHPTAVACTLQCISFESDR